MRDQRDSSLDIPSRIVRERVAKTVLQEFARYTLTYSEGTTAAEN